MPRFYENESEAVLYALDEMGSQERALVERLFEAFSKHPRPADCVPLVPPVPFDPKRPIVKPSRYDQWALKWERTIARDRKRERWRRVWWNPLRDEVIRFLHDNGHPFYEGRPQQWLEDAWENDAINVNEGRMFIIWDILVHIQEWIDTFVGDKEVYPEFWPLPVVELSISEAEGRYWAVGIAAGRVV
jgi:hypothetical protein